MSENRNVAQIYRINVILWMAFLASQFLFVVVLYFAKPQAFKFDFSKPLFGEIAVVVAVLAFIALLNFALSFFLKSASVKRAIEEQKPELMQTALVLACAFCESVSVIGMILAFVFDYQYFFLWFALGILGIILHFPKLDNYLAADYRKV